MAERRGFGRLPGGGTRWRITLTVAALSAVLLSVVATLTLFVVARGQARQLQVDGMQQLSTALAQLGNCQLPAVDGTSIPMEVSVGDRVLRASPLLQPHSSSGPILPESASPLALQGEGDGSLSAYSTTVSFATLGVPNDLNGRQVDAVYADLAVPVECPELSSTGAGTVRTLIVLVDYRADDVMAPLRTVLIWAVPLVSVIVAAAAWWSVGRSLRPVERMRRRLEDINEATGDRLPVPATADELAALASSLNGALDRLEASEARQRRFIADAAHELRSPVASLRSAVEVAALCPDPAGTADALAAVDRQSRRLAGLVDSLLVLEAMEAPISSPSGSTNLVALVIAELDQDRGGPVPSLEAATGLPPVRGNPRDLSRAVANLLDNAARHAATAISIELSAMEGGVELTVANDGPRIPPQDRERIFERLVRLDASRDSATGGAGLGLAIVASAAHRSGGWVRATERDSMTVFALWLPASEDPAS